MKIAVNTRLLLTDKLEGIGWFACETLKRITQQHPEHTFYFLFDRKYNPEFIFSDNIVPIVVPPQARHPLLWITWFDISLPLVFAKYKFDLFLSPDGMLSLNSNVKSLPVIHDLNFEHYPKDLPSLTQLYYHRYFPKFAKKATRIATVSEYSKNDLVKTYGVKPENVDVVYNGANDFFQPVTESFKVQIRDIYSQGADYFLFVGALHPRKNLANLFTAFDAFKESSALGTKLMIVGNKKWWTKEIQSAFNKMQYKSDVIFTGRLSTVELKNVIASALAITYVSSFEGFGIPILEGMYCDTPVITSNVTAMPEVGGTAVLTVDPFSVESIKNGLLKIANESSFRQYLVQEGRERRKLFTWQKTSERLWSSVEQTLSS